MDSINVKTEKLDTLKYMDLVDEMTVFFKWEQIKKNEKMSRELDALRVKNN